MKPVKVRETCRGERIVAIPKEFAKQIRTDYLGVKLVDGRLIYAPLQEVQ